MMLQIDPLKRYSAKECLDDEWFTQPNDDSEAHLLDPNIFKQL